MTTHWVTNCQCFLKFLFESGQTVMWLDSDAKHCLKPLANPGQMGWDSGVYHCSLGVHKLRLWGSHWPCPWPGPKRVWPDLLGRRLEAGGCFQPRNIQSSTATCLHKIRPLGLEVATFTQALDSVWLAVELCLRPLSCFSSVRPEDNAAKYRSN